MVKVYVGADHAGFELKAKIVEFLQQRGDEVVDLSSTFDKDDDYPDHASAVAKMVAQEGVRGILLCGSGIGMCIAANKAKGVRAALCRSAADAHLARQDNDANMLCLGGRITAFDEAKNIVEVFLSTPFAGESSEGARHKRRVEKLSLLD